MFAFPGMLVDAAQKAGMKVPVDVDGFDPMEFFHFHVFCTLQLGAAMPYPGVHFENAKVLAEIPEEILKTLTVKDVVDKGFHVGFPIP